MENVVEVKLSKPQPKQREFFLAKTRYVAFGGSRGGGKSWAVREKAFRLAIKHDGIRILIVRKTLKDLEDNHITPLRILFRCDLSDSIATYNDQKKVFQVKNGSVIRCSYFSSDNDALQYQGQEYDVIFIEEATQFTEMVFDTLKACNRGVNSFPKRIYLTCNPGGVGHTWVKRLFVDRLYIGKEKPSDYTFIRSRVYDNQLLVDTNPDYVNMLETLPEKTRKAWLDGDWDIFDGQFFTEFSRDIHVCEPFILPDNWRRYVSIDYGLDCLAVNFIAVDERRNAYVYKEIHESNLIVSAAAQAIKNMLMPGETIYAYLAPPDLWNRRQETGKTVADIFYQSGIALTKTSNDRVAGWLSMKEYLKPFTDEQEILTSKLKIFNNCLHLIADLPQLQYDEKNPSDCAKEPHEITHSPDSLRCFCVYWTLPTQQAKSPEPHYNFDFEKPKKDPLGKGVKVKVI